MSDMAFTLLWIAGPNGHSCPYALRTKHGDVVLAFLGSNERYLAFQADSKETLPQGFTLEETVVVVPDERQLAPAIAKNVPSNVRFGVAREGTDGFENILEQLADGSLWLDGDSGGPPAWCFAKVRQTAEQTASGTPLVVPPKLGEKLEKRRVFISYVRDDKERVNELVAVLRAAAIPVWVDTLELKPGVRWKDQIRNAIRDGAFFIAIFSTNSESRARTYMREELMVAVEEARLRPRNIPWLLPVLLDDVQLPDIPLGPGERLSDLQAARLYPAIRSEAMTLVDVLRSGLGLDVSTESIESLLVDLMNRQLMGQTCSLRVEYPDGKVRIGVPKHIEVGRNAGRIVVATSQGDIVLRKDSAAVVRVQYE